ncbi:hypothetical protein B9479_008389, partial [Cryptococcus floricola]
MTADQEIPTFITLSPNSAFPKSAPLSSSAALPISGSTSFSFASFGIPLFFAKLETHTRPACTSFSLTASLIKSPHSSSHTSPNPILDSRTFDYDLKVYGLEDKSVYVVEGGKPTEMEWIEWVQGRIVAWLSKRDEEVVKKQPRIYGGATAPLFFLRADGLMSEETAVEWRSWRKCLEKEVWHGLQSRVGVELVKARARTLW